MAHKEKLYQALTTETILVHMINLLLVLLLFSMGFADSDKYCPTYPINQFMFNSFEFSCNMGKSCLRYKIKLLFNYK